MFPMPATASAPSAAPRSAFRRLMRVWLLSALLCMAATAARAGSTADLDHDNGLPDAQLGAPLKSFQGLKQSEDTGRWLSYTRPADKLRYAGYEVQNITYNFFKEKLYSIDLDVAGGHNVKGLLNTLEKQYGKQHSYELHTYPKTAAQLEIREWAGVKAYCVYKSSTDYKGGVLILLDKPTWDLLQVPKREQEAQTREMLKGSFSNGEL